jgi:hypothetical protein
MAHLDIDTTTLEVATRALALFKSEYPDRLTVWAETAEGQLDIKISSIAKLADGRDTRYHIFFHKTNTLMEV